MYDVSDPGGRSAVKLEVITPFHGPEMSELVSQFMGSGPNPIHHGNYRDNMMDE